MSELFKTVLTLSIFGFGITAILLCLKPITVKKFPASWQYYAWIAVLISMLVPVYKLIPTKEVQKIPIIPKSDVINEMPLQESGEPLQSGIVEDTPVLYREVNITSGAHIQLFDLLAYIWFFGMCIYLIVVIGSYAVYTVRKRKNAVTVPENEIFGEAKRELSVKRHIKIRMSQDFESPMLVGVLFPVIYIPCREICDENMRMIFLHELTHYKRKDLALKWFALLVNAVHWFNPLAYLLCANVSEACEVSCDMTVTKNMSDSEQKSYMKTILDLAG